MTPGELKQLTEKLLKQIQGEKFSVLFVFGFVLLCNKESSIKEEKKKVKALLSAKFWTKISLHLVAQARNLSASIM